MSELLQQFETFKTSKTRVDFTELANLFDQLEPVQNEEMLGEWKGGSIISGTAIDISLKDFGFLSWIGKTFKSDNKVNALMYQLFGFKFNFPYFGKARIRQVHFRDKTSCAMIYNHLPIIDHFRRLDDNTMMGAMDLKGKIVFYFYLYR